MPVGKAILSPHSGPVGEIDVSTIDCDALDEFPPFDQSIAPSAEHPRIVGRDSPTFWRLGDWDVLRRRIMNGPDDPNSGAHAGPIGPRSAESQGG